MSRCRIFIVRVRREGVTTERAVIASRWIDAFMSALDGLNDDDPMVRIEVLPA
jgi:hypothetical protein